MAAQPQGNAQEIELTVLMPCLNEASTVVRCVERAIACIKRLGLSAEVLVADNGSTDGSPGLASAAGARIERVREPGYGAALYYGSLAAQGRYIVIGDADDSYDFGQLDDFVARLRAGADLVMGNRFAGGIEAGAMPWKNRYIGTPVLSFIGRLFFGAPIQDFNCGMRGYSSWAFRRMDLQTTGMEFASEMIIKATILGMRIEEVPTTLRKDGRNRAPHLRPWRDGWRHLRFMLLYSPDWLFLFPGLLLMVLGTVVGVALLPGPLLIAEGVALDVHSLLFAFAAVLIGFQAVSFAILARAYATAEGLLPPQPRADRFLVSATLEAGLIVGLALLATGFAGAVLAVARWSAVGFGGLDPRAMLRTAIPSVTAICLGGQVILTSFLLSYLRLRRRSVPLTSSQVDR